MASPRPMQSRLQEISADLSNLTRITEKLSVSMPSHRTHGIKQTSKIPLSMPSDEEEEVPEVLAPTQVLHASRPRAREELQAEFSTRKDQQSSLSKHMVAERTKHAEPVIERKEAALAAALQVCAAAEAFPPHLLTLICISRLNKRQQMRCRLASTCWTRRSVR